MREVRTWLRDRLPRPGRPPALPAVEEHRAPSLLLVLEGEVVEAGQALVHPKDGLRLEVRDA